MTHFTLFISDLHLDPSTPHITENFFHFLDQIAPKADALYILGDFFEAYIGDDDNNSFLQTLKKRLAEFTCNGPPTFLMHGNRDFLIGKKFAKETGVTLISDPTCVTLYHQKILLMHGDSLCTNDKSHQRFRIITQNKLIKKILLSLSLSFRQKLASKLRQESKQHNKYKLTDIMDVTQEAVVKAMRKFHVNTLIHGHTHRCATHAFSIDNRPSKRIVLDAWHEQGHYLRVDEDNTMENIHFSSNL